MPNQKIVIRPGVNTTATPLLNESGFSSSNLVRFFDGFLQKLGGWAKFFPIALHGACRSLIANQDANNIRYLVAGTNQSLEVYYDTNIYDITPVVSTVDLTTPFTTSIGSAAVKITDVASDQIVGNGIKLINNISVGGLILQGYYLVTSVVDADNYFITAASAATANAAAAGLPASYATTNLSASVVVTLANHGYSVNSVYTAYLSTTVGGVTIEGSYIIPTVINANSFRITAGTTASSTTSASENSGDAEISYLLESGNVSAQPGQGYGLGSYGYGYYGYGSTGALEAPRRWSLGEWGPSIVASPTNGAVYYWDSSAGVLNNPATQIMNAPLYNTQIFVAMPQQQIVSLGAEVGSVQDPLLVRYCDVSDFDVWIAASTNQAGSFRLTSGGRIVGGIQAQQQGLIWTETDLWVMQYVQPPFVYGFNQIGSGCGLIGSAAMGAINSNVYWMGTNNFYVFNGSSVIDVPCPVWDQVFRNLNTEQAEKITCAINSPFNEVTWYYPSASGNGENDKYVKVNVDSGAWDYGNLSRLAWLDQSILGMPIGVDENSYLQQHEISNNADGLPMDSWAETGLFKISDGEYFIFVERMYPDFIMDSGTEILITISTMEYAHGAGVISQTFTITENTDFIIVRMRGRYAKIKIESIDLGSFWRLGELIYTGSPAGRR